jgi:hypothetical protein
MSLKRIHPKPWTQYPMRFLPQATPVLDPKDNKVHAGGIPTEYKNEKGEMVTNADAVAYGVAVAFAKANKKGMSNAAWLIKHSKPNRQERRRRYAGMKRHVRNLKAVARRTFLRSKGYTVAPRA